MYTLRLCTGMSAYINAYAKSTCDREEPTLLFLSMLSLTTRTANEPSNDAISWWKGPPPAGKPCVVIPYGSHRIVRSGLWGSPASQQRLPFSWDQDPMDVRRFDMVIYSNHLWHLPLPLKKKRGISRKMIRTPTLMASWRSISFKSKLHTSKDFHRLSMQKSNADAEQYTEMGPEMSYFRQLPPSTWRPPLTSREIAPKRWIGGSLIRESSKISVFLFHLGGTLWAGKLHGILSRNEGFVFIQYNRRTKVVYNFARILQ